MNLKNENSNEESDEEYIPDDWEDWIPNKNNEKEEREEGKKEQDKEKKIKEPGEKKKKEDRQRHKREENERRNEERRQEREDEREKEKHDERKREERDKKKERKKEEEKREGEEKSQRENDSRARSKPEDWESKCGPANQHEGKPPTKAEEWEEPVQPAEDTPRSSPEDWEDKIPENIDSRDEEGEESKGIGGNKGEDSDRYEGKEPHDHPEPEEPPDENPDPLPLPLPEPKQRKKGGSDSLYASVEPLNIPFGKILRQILKAIPNFGPMNNGHRKEDPEKIRKEWEKIDAAYAELGISRKDYVTFDGENNNLTEMEKIQTEWERIEQIKEEMKRDPREKKPRPGRFSSDSMMQSDLENEFKENFRNGESGGISEKNSGIKNEDEDYIPGTWNMAGYKILKENQKDENKNETDEKYYNLAVEAEREGFGNLIRYKNLLSDNEEINNFHANYTVQKSGHSPIRNMKFTPHFRKTAEEQLSEDTKRIFLPVLDGVNKNGEIYKFIRHTMEKNIYNQTETAKILDIKKDLARKYIRSIEKDDIIRSRIQQDFGKKGFNLWDKFTAAVPINGSKEPRTKQFTGYMRENHLKLQNEGITGDLGTILENFLESVLKMGDDETKYYCFYHRVRLGRENPEMNNKILKGEVAESLHASWSFVNKMGFDPGVASRIKPEDFKNLNNVLASFEIIKNKYQVDLIHAYTDGSSKISIYDKGVFKKSFVKYVSEHALFKYKEVATVKNLIEGVETWNDSVSKPESEENKEKGDISKGIALHSNHDDDKFEAGEIRDDKTKPLKLVNVENIKNIIKLVGEEKTEETRLESIKNYIRFQTLLIEDKLVRNEWEKFKKGYKSPFDKRYELFATHLENNVLHHNNLKDELLTAIEAFNKRGDIGSPVDNYVITRLNQGDDKKEVAREIYISEQAPQRIHRAWKNGGKNKIDPEDVRVSEILIQVFQKIIAKTGIDLPTEYKKNIENPRGARIYRKNRVTYEFIRSFSRHEVFKTNKNEKIEKTIDLLRNLSKNNEHNKMMEYLGITGLRQIEIQEIMMINRSTVRAYYRKRMTPEEYRDRFGQQEENLILGQIKHKVIENIAIAQSLKIEDFGIVLREQRPYIPEAEFQTDLFIFPKESLLDPLHNLLELDKNKSIDYIIVDFTDSMEDSNLSEKIAKYQPRENGVLLLVCTNPLLNGNINLPESGFFAIHRKERIKCIGSENFADLLKLKHGTELKRQYNKATGGGNTKELESIAREMESNHSIKNDGEELELLRISREKGLLEKNKTRFEAFGNFDPSSIRSILQQIRYERDLKPKILGTFEKENKPLTLKDFEEILKVHNRQLKDTIRSMQESGDIKVKKIAGITGGVTNYYYVDGIEPPIHPDELKDEKIIKDFNDDKKVKDIIKDNEISPKTWEKKKKQHNLKRQRLDRKNRPFVDECVNKKWSKNLQNILLQGELNWIFTEILECRVDGKSYLDKNNPLTIKELSLKIKMKPSTIRNKLDNIENIFKNFQISYKDAKREPSKLEKWITSTFDEKNQNSFYSKDEFIMDLNKI